VVSYNGVAVTIGSQFPYPYLYAVIAPKTFPVCEPEWSHSS